MEIANSRLFGQSTAGVQKTTSGLRCLDRTDGVTWLSSRSLDRVFGPWLLGLVGLGLELRPHKSRRGGI